MAPAERVHRAVNWNQLSENQIKKLHEWEQKNLWNRFMWPIEIRIVLRKSDFKLEPIANDKIGELFKAIVAVKPRIDPDPYNLLHDGMNLHHAWDLEIKRRNPLGELDLK